MLFKGRSSNLQMLAVCNAYRNVAPYRRLWGEPVVILMISNFDQTKLNLMKADIVNCLCKETMLTVSAQLSLNTESLQSWVLPDHEQ